MSVVRTASPADDRADARNRVGARREILVEGVPSVPREAPLGVCEGPPLARDRHLRQKRRTLVRPVLAQRDRRHAGSRAVARRSLPLDVVREQQTAPPLGVLQGAPVAPDRKPGKGRRDLVSDLRRKASSRNRRHACCRSPTWLDLPGEALRERRNSDPLALCERARVQGAAGERQEGQRLSALRRNGQARSRRAAGDRSPQACRAGESCICVLEDVGPLSVKPDPLYVCLPEGVRHGLSPCRAAPAPGVGFRKR